MHIHLQMHIDIVPGARSICKFRVHSLVFTSAYYYLKHGNENADFKCSITKEIQQGFLDIQMFGEKIMLAINN